MEGLDPYVVDGRVGRDADWKGWIRTLLMEGLDWKGSKGSRLDPNVVAGRGLDPDIVTGRGLDPSSIGRGLERTSIGSVRY